MDVNELIKLLSAKDAQITQLLEQMKNLQARLDNLLRILYGKKSEKKQASDKSQSDTVSVPITKTKSPNNNGQCGRKKLPSNLPRTDIIYELTNTELVCDLCSNTCHKIGEEISEQLEMIPAKMFVKKHVRFKYACKNGCCVKVAPMPKQPIPKV